MIEIGDKAPDVRLRDSNGDPIALASLWQARPVALAFLRHSG
jgi:peroxiredoxin